jgi:hypothetical protein
VITSITDVLDLSYEDPYARFGPPSLSSVLARTLANRGLAHWDGRFGPQGQSWIATVAIQQ